MSGVATAIVGGAVIGGISANESAKSQSKAAGKAADAQVQANDKNIEFQKAVFDQQRADNAPWREIGAQSLQQLKQGIEQGTYKVGSLDQGQPFQFNQNFDFANVNLENDPGYKFRQQEGVNALDASASARGRLLSGAQQRAVSRYGQDLASQEFDKAAGRYAQQYNVDYGQATDQYNRSRQNALTGIELDRMAKNDSFNRLASLSNVGQVANSADQAARQQMAQNVGQSTTATGNALANGAISQGNARASAYQGMAQSANQGMQNYLLYDYMKGN